MRYFVEEQEEIRIDFVVDPIMEEIIFGEADDPLPEGKEAHFMLFRRPGWEEENKILIEASDLGPDGAPVINVLKLGQLRVAYLLKGWDFAEPLEQVAQFDHQLMLQIAGQLERELRRKQDHG